ncbi:ribonuclease H-like domain-containing protein [Tanacetum coccineum]
MNYQPVKSENQANKHAGSKKANHSVGTEDNIDAENFEIEAESAQDYFVLLIWSSYTSTVKSSKAKNAGEEPNKNPDLKTDEKPVDKEDQVFLDELKRLKRQEHDANDAAEALRKEFAKHTEDLFLQLGAAKASGTNTVICSTPLVLLVLYGGLSFPDMEPNDYDISALKGYVWPYLLMSFPTSRINSIHPSTFNTWRSNSAVQTRICAVLVQATSKDLQSNAVEENLRKSTTGGCQFLGGRLISWQCKMQTIVTTSTTEAEYVAVANCCRQVLWIQNC